MLPFHKAQLSGLWVVRVVAKPCSVWTEAPKVRTPLLFFLGAGEGNVTDQGGEGKANSSKKFIKDWRMPSSLQWSRVKRFGKSTEAKSSLIFPAFSSPFSPDPQTWPTIVQEPLGAFLPAWKKKKCGITFRCHLPWTLLCIANPVWLLLPLHL